MNNFVSHSFSSIFTERVRVHQGFHFHNMLKYSMVYAQLINYYHFYLKPTLCSIISVSSSNSMISSYHLQWCLVETFNICVSRQNKRFSHVFFFFAFISQRQHKQGCLKNRIKFNLKIEVNMDMYKLKVIWLLLREEKMNHQKFGDRDRDNYRWRTEAWG